MYLDSIDKRLLHLVQAEFPLTTQPYAAIGLRRGLDESEVIHRLAQLKAKGLLRHIGPVLEARSLGYETMLVAARVAEAQLEKAEQVIAEHPGVSHGYERDNDFNVWFTLALPSGVKIEAELERLASATRAEAMFSLAAIRVYRIGTFFDLGGDVQGVPAVHPKGDLGGHVELAPTERALLNELQQDLPFTPTPFNAMAAKTGMDVEHFLALCQSLTKRGVIRRFGASINHRQAGFRANAMACWVAPPTAVDTIGCRLASVREVSHCYERKTNALWPYNLFAMIHGHTTEGCEEIARQIASETGLDNYVLLFSTKEFKKARVKYLV